MSRSLIALFVLSLLSPAVFADDGKCEHAAQRDLKLELGDARAVVFDIGPHELKLEAANGASGEVRGRACASNAGLLDRLKLTQQRIDGKLVVRAYREQVRNGEFEDVGDVTDYVFRNNYGHLRLTATLPETIPVQLKVGSGDAWVSGVSALSIDAGSGDVDARRIQGAVIAKVNSGDITLDDIGSLHVLSIGSGDLDAKTVRGAAKVGSIGSGDFELKGAQDGVAIGSIGSGDANLDDIGGDVRVGSIGSGDVTARDVRGGLTVRSVGSGSIDHSDVAGKIDLPTNR